MDVEIIGGTVVIIITIILYGKWKMWRKLFMEVTDVSSEKDKKLLALLFSEVFGISGAWFLVTSAYLIYLFIKG